MKDTIFITGGSGLLAINWAITIRNQFEVILGLHKRKIAIAGVKVRCIDLDSVDSIYTLLNDIHPKMVIHTAGLTNVEECESRPEHAKYINVDLAENVAQACERLWVPLVHISTDHLFPGESSCVEENNPVAPQNIYGITKAEAELRVLKAYSQTLIVRTNFFGWGPSYRRSFSDLIIEALRENRQLVLFQDVFYTPILIETLVNTVHELIDRKASGIFNVVGGERISKYQFGLKLAEQFNLEPSFIKASNLVDQRTLVRRPRDMSLSNKKACDFLGKKLGDVNEYIAMLYKQEKVGLAREVQSL